MAAIDANILLRYLLQDKNDPHTQIANAVIEAQARPLLTDVVLAEMAWVLGGRRYRYSKQQLLAALHLVMQEFSFEDRLAVWAAINDFEKSAGAGFADALIAAKARTLGVSPVYTLDAKAGDLAGMEVVG